MTTESYIRRSAELGINRGHLATTFPVHEDLITVDKRTLIHGYTVIDPKRQTPPPDLVLEDLSYLNPRGAHKKGGRPRKQPSEDRFPLPGEISLKQWFVEESQRAGVRRWETVMQRFYRGYYPQLKLRKVNSRIIFVQQ